MKVSDPSAAQALFAAAAQARAHAYAPYSNFAVGAAVMVESGEIFAGANVENASYPNGLCAETAAIAAMIAAGRRKIVAALVIGESAEPLTPCGACRQRLSEFAAADMPLYVAGPEGFREQYTLGALLPASFRLAPRK